MVYETVRESVLDEWIRAHVVDVPRQTAEFCGDIIRDRRVLNVGCGEMLADHGLLHLGPTHITGLDVNPLANDWKETLAQRIEKNGHDLAKDHASRMAFVQYNGHEFPFEDKCFEFVFSWSAFEHVSDMRTVLREMRRVLTDDGRAFVQVYPWYFARDGSHLTPWISQPWFHLTDRDEWVRLRLEKYSELHGDRDFLIGHMYPEYLSLNKKTASDFYKAARESGFIIEKARLICFDEDLSEAPDGADFMSLMTRGTMMLMRKGGTTKIISSLHD